MDVDSVDSATISRPSKTTHSVRRRSVPAFKRKAESGRIKVGDKYVSNLRDKLDAKLGSGKPGTSDLSRSVAKGVVALTLPNEETEHRAIPVTTRGLSFSLWRDFQVAYSMSPKFFNNLGGERAAFFRTFRVAHLLWACRLQSCEQLATGLVGDFCPRYRLPVEVTESARSVSKFFGLAVAVLSGVGKITTGGLSAVPVMYESFDTGLTTSMEDLGSRKRRRRTTTHRLPRATEINIHNLREVAEQLATTSSPAAWRAHMRAKCCIPFLEWSVDDTIPTVMVDQIISEEYLERDYELDVRKINDLMKGLSFGRTRGYISSYSHSNEGLPRQVVYCEETPGDERQIIMDGTDMLAPGDVHFLFPILIPDIEKKLGAVGLYCEAGPARCYSSRTFGSSIGSWSQSYATLLDRVVSDPDD